MKLKRYNHSDTLLISEYFVNFLLPWPQKFILLIYLFRRNFPACYLVPVPGLYDIRLFIKTHGKSLLSHFSFYLQQVLDASVIFSSKPGLCLLSALLLTGAHELFHTQHYTSATNYNLHISSSYARIK